MKQNKFGYGVGIAGVGKYLPEDIISNRQLEKSSGIKASDIEAKTGIRERRVVKDGQTASEMSAIAAKRALEMAGVSAEQLSLVVT